MPEENTQPVAAKPTAKKSEPVSPKPTIDDADRCAKLMRSLRGIGVPASVRLVKSFSAQLVKQIVQADESGNGRKINQLIGQDIDRIAKEAKASK